MWLKFKALPKRTKVALVVVFVLGVGVYGVFFDSPNSSSSYRPSVRAAENATSASPVYAGGMAAMGRGPSNTGRFASPASNSQLADLIAQYNSLKQQADECTSEIGKMSLQNFAPPPCEAEMQANVGRVAVLEAQIYRLQGVNAQPVDFVNMNSSSSSPTAGGSELSDGARRFSREGILGQSKYTDADGREYQLDNTNRYYFKDRASGAIVGSELAQPPDNQRDWEQLTYQRN
jgi:hypothetical protein